MPCTRHGNTGVPQIPYVPRIAITQSYVYDCAADAKDDRQPPSTWCSDCNRCVPAVKDVAEKRKAFLLEVSVGPKKGVTPRTVVANHVMQLHAKQPVECMQCHTILQLSLHAEYKDPEFYLRCDA